ncbi:hypothetical protein FLP10_10845 [Agromyces intestinalis]|uniref:Uncharacterized protein n=1 Tax=Agromyces intestinalis TaxID=2592652 RepID=A0A5C1YHH0_9MICO|nr:hypothetical protein [Agromyces intestinalis]QEO14850.1 hypothetical protein FLP10_10845 [Agromyces intestinalis]
MRPNAVVATTTLLLLALTACSAAPEPTPEPPTPAPTASTPPIEAALPYTCDDLVPGDLVAATLQGGDGTPVEPVPATYERFAFADLLLTGAGGLACSWRVGTGMPDYNGTDWAYLRVDVLPGGALAWTPEWAGDAPSTESREIAGVEASVAVGDSGWRISAPVGDAWLRATISAAGLTGSGSRFLGVDAAEMLDRLAVAASSAAEAVQAAPDRAAWQIAPLRDGEAACTGGLAEPGVVEAEQLDGASYTYALGLAATREITGFDDAVRVAARTFDCELVVDGFGPLPLVTIETARGLGDLFARIGEPDTDAAFVPLELADVPAGQHVDAAVRSAEDGPSSPVILRVGDTVYEINGDGAAAVAQAIVHQTY